MRSTAALPRPFLLFGGAVVASFLLYLPSLSAGFLSDDFALVDRVVRVHPLASWGGFLRPVTTASLFLDRTLHGLSATGFHSTNILLHGLNAALVFLLVERWLLRLAWPRAAGVAGVAAAIFLVLPSHSEAVSWIAGRGDLIATLFGLGACLVLVERRPANEAVRLAIFAALFALALFAKEAAIVLPPVLFLLAFTEARVNGRPIDRASRAILVASVVVLVVYLGVRRTLLGELVGGYGAAHHVPSAGKALANAGRYTLRVFTGPWDPRVKSPVPQIAALVVASSVLALWRRREPGMPRWVLATPIAAFLIALAPTLSLGVSKFSTEGERFLYLPSIFASVAVAMVALSAPRPRRAALALVAFLAVEVWALVVVQERWTSASALARAFARELATFDEHTTLVLAAPDNLRGVYVFRNGLGEAVTAVRGAETPVPFEPWTRWDLRALGGAPRVETTADGVRVALGETMAARPVEPPRTGLDVTEDAVALRFDALPGETRTLVVPSGRLAPALLAIPVPSRE